MGNVAQSMTCGFKMISDGSIAAKVDKLEKDLNFYRCFGGDLVATLLVNEERGIFDQVHPDFKDYIKSSHAAWKRFHGKE